MTTKHCKHCDKSFDLFSFSSHDCVSPFSEDIRRKLEKLWFVYGNYGPKCTPENHKFIQRLVEGRRQDAKAWRRTGVTKECRKAVREVIGKL